MQYIQLQPQIASNVTLPTSGSFNLFLDNKDNLVKVVGLSGTTSVVYGPTGNGVYITGGTYNPNTGVAILTNSIGTPIVMSGFQTSDSVTLTKSQLDSTIANSGLTAGNLYKITGVNPELYGGTDIIVNAITSSEISKNGYGLFYNPDYGEYDIWSPYSTLGFNNLDGFFTAGEIILGNSGQTGTLVGLPGDETLTFIADVGVFSAGTVVTGFDSGATALTVNLATASYNIDDKVIWGGKVWKNVSGNSITIVNKVIATGGTTTYFNFNLPAGTLHDTLVITCDSEVLTGDSSDNFYNIQGDAGGEGHIDNSGYVYGYFNTPHNGFDIVVSYSANVNQKIGSFELGSAWQVVPYDDVDYTPTWDIIEYEYEYDNISLRKDVENEVSSAWAVSVDYWGWNSIKGMQWGGNIYQLTAKNPYLENLVNFNGNNMDRVTIGENGGMDCYNWNIGINIGDIFINDGGWLQFDTIGVDSYIHNITIGATSNVEGITLANNDGNNMYFIDINLGNSADDCGTYIEYIRVGASCSFYGINLDSSSSNSCTYIYDISLNNNSRVFNVKIDQGGYIDNLNLYNDAQANNIQIGQGSYIEDGYIYNDGQLHSIILEGGTTGSNQNYQGNWSPCRLSNFHIGTSSYMHDIKIGLGSVIENIYLDNETGISGNYFHYISLNNNSTIADVYFNGSSSYFGDGSFGVNSYVENITLSGSSYFGSNAIGDDVYVNDIILQDNTEFYNNTLLNGTSFDGMYLTNCDVYTNIFKGGNVNDNYIYNDFYNNEIGVGFTGNNISGETYNNIIGERFEYNTIYGSFSDNQIFNEFKSNIIYQNFSENRTDWGFGSNHISGYCSANVFGVAIDSNDFLGDVYSNTFKGGVFGNTIGNNFTANNIGFGFSSNVIGENFGYGASSPQGNIIGNSFTNNTIGEYFYNNTIPDNFYENEIGNYFQWNVINTNIDRTYFTLNYGNITGFSYTASGTGATDSIYTNLTGTTNGHGVDATFNVEVSGDAVIGVTGSTQGRLYSSGDTLTILGTQIGGVTGVIDGFNQNAVGKSGTTGSYTNVIATGTGGGENATFDINVTNNLVSSIVINNRGGGYSVNETLTISGSAFGGITGIGNITITVNAIYSDDVVITVTGTTAGSLFYDHYTKQIFERKGGNKRVSFYDEDDILNLDSIYLASGYIPVYSQSLTFPIPAASFEFWCDGAYDNSGRHTTNQTVNNAQELIALFNNNFRQYGYFFDNNDGTIGLYITPSLKQQHCPNDIYTINVYND
jgi:hypothetical protein